MKTPQPLEHILFLDIETVPEQPDFKQLSEEKHRSCMPPKQPISVKPKIYRLLHITTMLVFGPNLEKLFVFLLAM